MTVGDLGLASALLQQRDLNEGQASAVFLVNLLAGFAFGGLFLLSSPLLGSLYGDPRVTQVAAALSIMFVFSGFTAVQVLNKGVTRLDVFATPAGLIIERSAAGSPFRFESMLLKTAAFSPFSMLTVAARLNPPRSDRLRLLVLFVKNGRS